VAQTIITCHHSRKKEKMKRIITFTIILMVMTACTVFRVNSEPAVTEGTQVNMPNPASVYCTQNGNKLEIRTAADGSQSGVCVFPNGSTCDEWAYYRGECSSAASPAVENSPTPEITLEATSEAGGGSSGGNASGGYMPPGTTEDLADWWGVIKGNGPGAEFDDCFLRQDLGQIIYFGIDSRDPTVESQIVALRDSGKIVHLYGTLVSNVPDCNGSQVLVERIEVEE
jgi:putative hemolysin